MEVSSMKVRDLRTGNILETESEFLYKIWLLQGSRYQAYINETEVSDGVEAYPSEAGIKSDRLKTRRKKKTE